MTKKILILSWVNPNLVPPVIAIIRLLKANGLNIHVITTDSTKSVPEIDGENIDFVEFNPAESLWRRQVKKWHFFQLVKERYTEYNKVIVFDNLSFICARLFLGSQKVFYNILEMFEISLRSLIRSPLDSLLAISTILLIKTSKYSFFSIPSLERILWFSKSFNVPMRKFKLIYNTPFVTEELLNKLQQKEYNHSKPVILHSGGVNDTRSVIELVKGFERMGSDAFLVITNVNSNPYCDSLLKVVSESNKKNEIVLKKFLSYDEMEKVRNQADIGICLMKPNNYDSINIAPNKVGEYLSSGLFLLVSKNSYYDPFQDSELIVQSKTLEPDEIGKLLDDLVQRVKDLGTTFSHQELLNWYCMNVQAQPVLDFINDLYE